MHKLWQNLFYSFIAASISFKIEAAPQGILNSLKQDIKISEENLIKLYKQASEIKFEEIDKSNKSEYVIHPDLLKSALLYTPSNVLNLLRANECNLYSLIEKQSLISQLGPIKTLLVYDQTNPNKIFRTPVQPFLKYVFERKCLSIKGLSSLFESKNIEQTLASIKISPPKNNEECSSDYRKWANNIYTPYMCNLLRPEISKELNLKYEQVMFLENICNNIGDESAYCKKYLQGNFWGQVLNGSFPKYHLDLRCKNILNNQSTKIDYKKCIELMDKKPEICSFEGLKDFPSIFPRPNCQEISDALKISRLKTPYRDCPAQVSNEAMINMHRIIMHFSPRDYESNKYNCASETEYSFALMNIANKSPEKWPLQICYTNIATKQEVCTPYYPGDKQIPEAETSVLKNVIVKLVPTATNFKCKILEDKDYRPYLLEYKHGCFVTFSKENCTTESCPKKIIYDTKLVSGIIYKGSATFDYFPNSFSNEHYALSNILKNVYKLRSTSVKSFTDIKNFLQLHKEGIIHGVGCAEILYPRQFPSSSLNTCTPLPFIIDGAKEDGLKFDVSFRSSIDDVLSPRILDFNFVFSSVKEYQTKHPTGLWSLQGITK